MDSNEHELTSIRFDDIEQRLYMHCLHGALMLIVRILIHRKNNESFSVSKSEE